MSSTIFCMDERHLKCCTYMSSLIPLSDHHPWGSRDPRERERNIERGERKKKRESECVCVCICHLDSNKKQNMPPALCHEKSMMV
jgi:hypothetical protein